MPASSERRGSQHSAARFGCLLVLSFASAALGSTQPGPNIVLILADDLGWNDVGYHGSEISTPNIDALAAQGVVLNQFHSQPTCTPTRAALMTGKSPQRMGIYRQFAKISTEGLPVGEKTLADHLRAAGYQTWLTGKWHLGHSRAEFHPNPTPAASTTSMATSPVASATGTTCTAAGWIGSAMAKPCARRDTART